MKKIEEFSPYKIKPSEYKDVTEDYTNGNTVQQISEKYGVNIQTIYRILKKCKISANNAGRPKSTSEEIELEIVNKYKEGMSSVQIAKLYKVSPTTVLNIIKSKGVYIRNSGPSNNSVDVYQFKRKVSIEGHQEIADLYLSGFSTPMLSEKFGVSRERICKILESMNVSRRSRIISDAESNNIIELYKSGMSVSAISVETKRSQASINKVLVNNGVVIKKGRGVNIINTENIASGIDESDTVEIFVNDNSAINIF